MKFLEKRLIKNNALIDELIVESNIIKTNWRLSDKVKSDRVHQLNDLVNHINIEQIKIKLILNEL